MIEKILEDYKNITEKIIIDISKDEEVLKLMNEREKLIKLLFSSEENKDKIRDLYLSMGLLNLDEELRLAIDKERLKVKEEIRKLHNIKSANNAYDKNRRINNFFSTKI